MQTIRSSGRAISLADFAFEEPRRTPYDEEYPHPACSFGSRYVRFRCYRSGGHEGVNGEFGCDYCCQLRRWHDGRDQQSGVRKPGDGRRHREE